MSDSAYVGDELRLFAEATRWKAYVESKLRPFFGRRVLEVGAGIGMTTSAFCRGDHEEWVCLEPDPAQSSQIEQLIEEGELPGCCQVSTGTIDQLPVESRFDTILYIDVLEHIEHDREEARQASSLLERGGHLMILSPAHSWLFTPFDEAIGHWRRYTRGSLAAVIPEDLAKVRLDYLDSVGLFASLGNRLLLRQDMPTRKQIFIWDKAMVPISRAIDPMTFFRLGKSILGIWQNAVAAEE